MTLNKAAKDTAALVDEAVNANHIAQVVSRWTGVPVDKMLEGERDKLLKMEEVLAKRVIGQSQAVGAVSKAVRRARAGLQDVKSSHWLVYVSGANRCWQNGTDQSVG